MRGVDVCLILDQFDELITCPIQEEGGAYDTCHTRQSWLFFATPQWGCKMMEPIVDLFGAHCVNKLLAVIAKTCRLPANLCCSRLLCSLQAA